MSDGIARLAFGDASVEAEGGDFGRGVNRAGDSTGCRALPLLGTTVVTGELWSVERRAVDKRNRGVDRAGDGGITGGTGRGAGDA